MPIELSNIYQTLKTYYGYEEFLNGQLEIINSLLAGIDTLGVMPTGAGKSLCYQLPAILVEGCAIIVSPLIALMQDQVYTLKKKGIAADFINSSLKSDEIQDRLFRFARNQIKLLYIAPERLESEEFFRAAQKANVSFYAVDEAHCISEWGHDFRPSYLLIPKLIERIGRKPIIALTATATPEAIEDIAISLKMRKVNRFIKGFNRPNLSYICENSEINKAPRVAALCQDYPAASTIVYCGSRKRTEAIGKELNSLGVKAEIYHAGMSDNMRKQTQERFLNGSSRIIVATSAFGMGIDKADVRQVIHCDLPPSLEAYYQEAGRAGRDRNDSRCVILYNKSDKSLQEFFIDTNYPSIKILKSTFDAICEIFNLSPGQRAFHSLMIDETQIANHLKCSVSAVDSALRYFERKGIVSRPNSRYSASIKFTVSIERIEEYHEHTNSSRKKVIEALIRSTGNAAFREPTEIDLNSLKMKYQISDDEISSAILALTRGRMIEYAPLESSTGFSLLVERMPFERLPIDFASIETRRDFAVRKLKLMIAYAEAKTCKRNFILDYFKDDEYSGECGKCSSCKGYTIKKTRLSQKDKDIREIILYAVAELNGKFGKKNDFRISQGRKFA